MIKVSVIKLNEGDRSSFWKSELKNKPHNFIETENRMEVARSWGREKWGQTRLMGTDSSVWENEKVLEMDVGDGCTTI